MTDYSKGKIYKIVGNGLTYYGSTCYSLNRRLAGHEYDYNRFLDGKSDYVSSYDIISEGEYTIELVEEYSCETRKELELREGFYIRNNECVNKTIPGRTKKEYRDEHKEDAKEWSKIWRDKNKEKIKENKKKEYEKNKEKIKERSKLYRELHKSEISLKRKINVKCPKCNMELRKESLNGHMKNKH